VITLGDIEAALRCGLPVLPEGADPRSPIGTCVALRSRGRSLIAAPARFADPRVAAANTSRELLALRPAHPGAELSLYEALSAPRAPVIDFDKEPICESLAAGTKLVLRGYPSDLLRVDNDDGSMRWRSMTLTAHAAGEGELLLDEPDSIAHFEGLIGAPVFALLEEGALRFAGILIDAEKRSVLGRGCMLSAHQLLARPT
jgi:hypothetical protein